MSRGKEFYNFVRSIVLCSRVFQGISQRSVCGKVDTGIPPVAHGRHKNDRKTTGNVHFCPLFREGSCEALTLDTLGRDGEMYENRYRNSERRVFSLCPVFTPQSGGSR